MAGGVFYSKNKKLSGFYYNVQSKKVVNISQATRGVVAYCMADPDWFVEGITRVTPDTNLLNTLGHQNLDFVTDMFKGSADIDGATEILVYIPSTTGGTKATATVSDLTITAKRVGTLGNGLTCKIDRDTTTNEYVVRAYLGGILVEKSRTTTISNYRSIWFDLSGTLAEIVATELSGGTNGTISSTAYNDFLEALETYRFNVLCYDGDDSNTKALISTFLEKYRDDLGRCCRAVVNNYSADYERITSVNITSITLSDGSTRTGKQLTWWVSGVEAGANGNQDLTNQAYPNAISVTPRLTDDEQLEMIANGQLSFVEEYGEVRILSDINTLVTFTDVKGKTWSYNELIRTIDEIGNDWHKYFTLYYNGKIKGVDAVSVARAYVVDYLNNMVNNGYISEYTINDISYNAEDRYTSIDFYIVKAYSPDKVYCTMYV